MTDDEFGQLKPGDIVLEEFIMTYRPQINSASIHTLMLHYVVLEVLRNPTRFKWSISTAPTGPVRLMLLYCEGNVPIEVSSMNFIKPGWTMVVEPGSRTAQRLCKTDMSAADRPLTKNTYIP